MESLKDAPQERLMRIMDKLNIKRRSTASAQVPRSQRRYVAGTSKDDAKGGGGKKSGSSSGKLTAKLSKMDKKSKRGGSDDDSDDDSDASDASSSFPSSCSEPEFGDDALPDYNSSARGEITCCLFPESVAGGVAGGARGAGGKGGGGGEGSKESSLT
jgi:hypothetical protein